MRPRRHPAWVPGPSTSTLVGGGRAVPTLTAAVLTALERLGLLLKQDRRLPSVVTIIAGEPLSTSWWSHPRNHLIFEVLSELADHRHVLLTKLLYGKDTLVHRSLWPAFLAVATSREQWQMRRLSAAGRRLFDRTIRSSTPITSAGAPVKELAARLLVHTVEVHTARGKHQVAVVSWRSWAANAGAVPLISLSQAREELEGACRILSAPLSALPWHRPRPPANNRWRGP